MWATSVGPPTTVWKTPHTRDREVRVDIKPLFIQTPQIATERVIAAYFAMCFRLLRRGWIGHGTGRGCNIDRDRAVIPTSTGILLRVAADFLEMAASWNAFHAGGTKFSSSI